MTNPFKRRAGAALAVVAACAAAAVYAQTKAAEGLPKVGQPAPAYSLQDGAGKVHSLSADKGHPVLIAFYPADFTGGCTMEAHSLSSSYADLKKLGVTVYGVSVQDAKSHAAFCSKEGIPYPLLADTKFDMARAYGVLIPGANIANRVTFLVGADGKIAYVDPNVNGHLMTAGPDWVAWVKAHPQVKRAADANMYHNYDTGTVGVLLRPVSAEGHVGLGVPNRTLQVATVGRTAPAFTLPDAATGKPLSLQAAGAGKKATVVMFIATRCPVSNAYNTRMAALAKTYSAKGITFVGINANTTEPVAEVASHAKAHGFPFPVLKDADDKTADAYAAKVTPEAYVVGADGTLLYHGAIDDSMDESQVTSHPLAVALDAVLAGKAVASGQLAAFGCSIKRGTLYHPAF